MGLRDSAKPLSSGQSPAFVVGYISSHPDEGNTHLGVTAYLSVDQDGRPVEFLCTEAVAPGRFTQLLYGSSLAQVAREKAAGTLLVNVEQRPKWVFVNEACLLNPQPSNAVELILLRESGHFDPLPGWETHSLKIGDRQYNLTVRDTRTLAGVAQSLENLTWDPLEPFQRLHSLHEELSSPGN